MDNAQTTPSTQAGLTPGQDTERNSPASSPFTLRDRPTLKTFLGGFIGTIPYAFMRGHAQIKNKEMQAQQADPDLPQTAAHSIPMELKNQSKKAMEAVDLFDDKTRDSVAQTYTEFAYSFFSFLTGVLYIKPLLDRIFPDTPKEGETPKEAPKTNPIRQTGQYLARVPAAAAAALIPYALSGGVLDKTIFAERTDPDGNPVERTGIDKMINTPFAKLQLKIGLMFSTFNLSYHFANKLLDKVIGPRVPESQEEQPTTNEANETLIADAPSAETHDAAAQDAKQPGLFKRAITGTRDLLTGIVAPVMISVTPLVATFFYANRNAFEEDKAPEDRNIIDHVHQLGFAAGDLMNNVAEKAITPLIPNALADRVGLDEAGKNHAAKAILYMSTAYGAYAATRSIVNPIAESLLGHSSQQESKATPTVEQAVLTATSKENTQILDQPAIGAAQDECGCSATKAIA